MKDDGKPVESVDEEQPSEGGSSVPARGTVQLLIARVGFLGIGYVVSVILARHLGKAAYGSYTVCLNLLVFLEMSSNAGLQAATTRMIQQGDPSRIRLVESTAKAVHLVISTLVFLLVFLFVPQIAAWLELENGSTLLRIAILDLPVAGLYYAYQGVLGGHRKFGRLAIGFIAYALAKLLGIVVLLALGVTVEGALIVNIAATVGGILVFLGKAGAGMQAVRPSASLGYALLALAVPMGMYLFISQAVLSSDLLFLQALGGDLAVTGGYGAASTLAKALTVVPSALSGVVFASIARALAHEDQELVAHHVRSGGRFALISLLPAAAFASLHAEEIMRFVYSEKFADAGVFFATLVFVIALAGILDVYSHTLMAAGRERFVALTVGIGIPLVLFLHYRLIPEYGGRGAAWATLTTIGLSTLVIVGAVRARFRTLLPRHTLLRVLLATGVGCALGWWIPSSGFGVVLELAGLCLAYVLVLILLGEISKQDLRRVLPW